mgnify:CR=1 FL=1
MCMYMYVYVCVWWYCMYVCTIWYCVYNYHAHDFLYHIYWHTLGLLALNGVQAGADDFFPILVYVIIQANPPHLLSTVQYIQYFYESRATGEASYFWSQFQMAVEFIKTLNPDPTKKKPNVDWILYFFLLYLWLCCCFVSCQYKYIFI